VKPGVPLQAVKEQDDGEDLEDTVDDTPSKPRKLRAYPFITDLKTWKKKQRLDESVKVFIIMGGYQDLKKSLLRRGWVENPDSRSPCFDLKFTLMSKDIDYGALTETQIVNHYERNTAITTKVGICKNLRNLIWFNNVDIDSFYPRCFDCNDENDFEDFLEDFKTTKAESILKLYMHFYK
jgi:tubulin monoglycylase TTLL3/8